MKKLKFLLALFALLVGTTASLAQKDVTSQYIKNATLSSLDGWTNVKFNSPVQGNNTVGYASECYAGWGALENDYYSLSQTITLPAGSYRLVNYSFYRYGANDGVHNNLDTEKSLGYLFAGDNNVKISTLYSVTGAEGYANSQAEGANCFDSKMYRNVVEFTIAADNTPIEIGIQGTHEVTAGWIIVGQFELFDLNDLASVSSPTDVTYAITNAGFEYRNLTGWTTEKDATDGESRGGFWYMNNDALSGKAGVAWVESYKGGGLPDGRSIYQTLTGLTNGLYEVTVYGHLQQGSGSDGFYLYANNDKVAIGSTDQDYSVRTTVTDGNLTIKLTTQGCNGNWAAFDKVRMKFYGDPLAAYQDLLDEAVDGAQTLIDGAAGSAISATAKAAWQAIVDANDNDDKVFTQESQFNAAIENITNANTNYQAMAVPYALWLKVKASADEMALVPNNDADATNTFNDVISAQNSAAEAALTAADLNKATATLKTAVRTFINDAEPTAGNKFEITCLIENPSFDNNTIDGWTREVSSGGNAQTNYTCNEFWNNTFDFYQDLPDLPNGSYQLSVQAFSRPGGNNVAYSNYKNGINEVTAELYVNNDASTVGNIYAYTGNTTGPKVNGGGFPDYKCEVDEGTDYWVPNGMEGANLYFADENVYKTTVAALVENGTLRIGFRDESLTDSQWTIFDNFRLYYYGSDKTVYYKQYLPQLKAEASNDLKNDYYVNVTGEERNAFTAALDATPTSETESAYQEIIDNIKEKQAAFREAKVSYDAYLAAKAVEYEDNLPYASSSKFAAIATAQEAAEATSASDAQAKIAAIISAYRLYVESNAMAEGVDDAEDKTSLIVDPNFVEVTIDEENQTAGGWKYDQIGENVNIFNSQPLTDGSGNTYSYFDYYDGSNNNQNIHQVIEDLEPGRYLLTTAGRGAANFNDNLQLYVEGKGSVMIPAIGGDNGTFGNGWNDVSLEFNVLETSDITIGVKTDKDEEGWWSATRFRLVKLGNAQVTIDENIDYVVEAATCADVTLNRTIKANTWNTFVVPFDIDNTMLKEQFGGDVEVAICVEEANMVVDNSAIYFYILPENETGITANVPVLLKTSTAGSSYTFNGVTVKAVEGELIDREGTNYDFVGTYAASITLNKGDYFIGDNKLWEADPDNTIVRGTRAYFRAKNAEARIIDFRIGEKETTGIVSINNGVKSIDNATFDLQGRKVTNVKKGLYIKNSKKVVVK